MQYLLQIFFIGIFTWTAYGAQVDEGEEKARMVASEQEFIYVMATFKEKLEQAPHKEFATDILAVHKEFRGVYINNDMPEAWWTHLAQQWQTLQFPSQSHPKDQVAGGLFYPARSHDLFYERQFPYLETFNSLYRLACAARYKHTMAAYILGVRLRDKMMVSSYDAWTTYPQVLQSIFAPILRDVQQINPQQSGFDYLCFIKGRLHEQSSFFPYEPKKVLPCYETSMLPLNRMAALDIRNTYKLFYPSPSLEDYLTLAREGYVFAYERVIEKASEDQKPFYRQEAHERGYCFKDEGPRNYIIKAQKILGFSLFIELPGRARVMINNPQGLSDNQFQQVEALLMQAAQAGYPSAWGKLAYFYWAMKSHAERHQTGKAKVFENKMWQAAAQGLAMYDEETLRLYNAFSPLRPISNGASVADLPFGDEFASTYYLSQVCSDIGNILNFKNIYE